MSKKEKAYELFVSGFSYGYISDALSISKSTAHSYVQQMKYINNLPVGYKKSIKSIQGNIYRLQDKMDSLEDTLIFSKPKYKFPSRKLNLESSAIVFLMSLTILTIIEIYKTIQ